MYSKNVNKKKLKYGKPYDIIIIGGGIAGLYCAHKLSKNNKVALFDERSYIGGRIYTHPKGYEVGAARFNNNHKLLLELIKYYKLTKMVLPKEIDYIECFENKKNKITLNSNIEFQKILNKVIERTKTTKNLNKITFYEHLVNILKSKEKADHVVNIFGYYSEIKEMNALDAYNTFKNDFGNIQYYILMEGLSSLCEKMKKTIERNGSKIFLKSYVNSVEKNKNVFKISIKDKKRKIIGKKVIFATKPHQLKQFEIIKPIHKYINSVYEAPLIRMYAIYKNIWFKNINRTTTNNLLRQIIPINKEKGLIMISYTDGEDTKPFMKNKYELKSDNILKKIVSKNIKKVFPDHNIEDPEYFKAHLWNVGCHHWLPGYDSSYIQKEIMNPLENIYICGEGFSDKQAWIEGALNSALKVIKNINK
uniref:Amine oxidase domain-containing protein n=1 Tax=viral metagenome TaxID=1070528 RepID=A0A6C0AGL1_9ZZZZ|tara:strand:- start:1978 stop:3237 length:1260 start_codon:yes stop_codon:yes gene_type:complete